MPGFGAHRGRVIPRPDFDAAPLNYRSPEFAAIAAANGLAIDISESAGSKTSGQRIRAIYLNDPALQNIYPLGLLPFGQLHFLNWLTNHGRKDQGLTDAEIYGFLRESAENERLGLALTYLLQPAWQQRFPLAPTARGWGQFRDWIEATYGPHLLGPVLEEAAPPLLMEQGHIDADSTNPPLGGVNILSHFCNPSGIQQAAFWTKTALERAALRTSCRDVPVPRRIAPSDRDRWLGLENYPVTILTHAAAPYFEDGYERAGLLPREKVYRIAYWAWELETVPDEWVKAAELVDEIWSPTAFVANAMRSRMPCPVYHMLPGVEAGPVQQVSRKHFGIPEDDFVFLFMFDLHSQLHRKNPLGVYRAFREAFRHDDRASLLIKTSGGDIHTSDLKTLRETIYGPKVVLYDGLMTRAEAYGLIDMADCFVSLHRSEGFGLGLAEAMLMGKPVIATGYSGNLDFMNTDNSLLVDYALVEINEDRPIYSRGNVWAEPSVERAAAYMREVYDGPEEARARAERARPGIARLLSLEAAGRRMRTRLEQIVGA